MQLFLFSSFFLVHTLPVVEIEIGVLLQSPECSAVVVLYRVADSRFLVRRSRCRRCLRSSVRNLTEHRSSSASGRIWPDS
jgi:hypothetical protein